MTWASLVTGFLGDIAWPAVLIVVVIILRRELRALLARVTKVVTPIGSLDTEARTIAGKASDIEAEALEQLGANHRGIEEGEAGDAALEDFESDSRVAIEHPTKAVVPRAVRSRWVRPDSDGDAGILRELADGIQGSPGSLPKSYSRALEAAERLVSVAPDESVKQAWNAFWNASYDAVPSEMRQIGDSTLVRLAKLGFPHDGLEIVKELEAMKDSRGSFGVAGAKDYLETVRRMAGIMAALVTDSDPFADDWKSGL